MFIEDRALISMVIIHVVNVGKEGDMNLRQRINAHCKSCIYDPADSLSWRQQVESCTCTDCEFWDIRPIPVAVNVKLPMIDKEYLFSDDMPNSPSEPLRAIVRH